MNKKDFEKLLKERGYKYYKKGADLIVTHKGSVYLRSCTSLPEGIKFENQGSVYLRSCTSLPEGIKFENQGYVYLESCTSLPEGIKFENQGSVDLESCTKINYLGKGLNLKWVDGSTMIIDSQKTIDDFTIYHAKYFKGGSLDILPKCYIAEKGEYFAHGETIKEAIEDVNFKFLQNNFDLDDLVKKIKEKQTINKNDYRLLTGACSLGVENFKKDNNIEVDELPLEQAKQLIRGHYGYERFIELLEAA